MMMMMMDIIIIIIIFYLTTIDLVRDLFFYKKNKINPTGENNNIFFETMMHKKK